MRTPRDAVLAAAVLAAVLLAHAPALRGAFVWDDRALVSGNPGAAELQSPLAYLGEMFWAGAQDGPSPAFYRPLVIASYALQVQHTGSDPLPFHAANLLLHLLCCALVFGLARGAGAGRAAASLTALLFGTLPRLTESVSWVSGRTDLLAALGALAAWRLHRSGRHIWASIALGFGLLGKEVAAAGFAALAAHELARVRRGGSGAGDALRRLAPGAAMLLAYAALRTAAFEANAPRIAATPGLPWDARPWVALQTLGTYAAMLAQPLRPSARIGILGIVEWHLVALGALGAAGLAVGAALLWRRRADPAVLAAAALCAAALAPVLHLVPIPVQAVAADRYLYLPAAALAVLGALAAGRLGPAYARPVAGIALSLALAFAITTSRRASVWADELRFWRAAVREAPSASPAALVGLGEALLRRGRPAEAIGPLEEARRRQRALAPRVPDSRPPAWLYGNLALCQARLGRLDEALATLEKVKRDAPHDAAIRYGLALIRAQRLEFDRAERELARALAREPDHARARALQGAVGVGRREWEALPPPRADEPAAVRAARGQVYARLGNLPAARQAYTAVLEAPDAGPDALHAAALHLFLAGEPDAARRALARLQGVPALRARVRQLEQALDRAEGRG